MKKVLKPLGVIFLIILIALTGCKKSDSGTNSENPSTPTIPTGAINGLFTINENGGQVYFSQGNLQYQASTDTWRFAEHQWDYIGMDNENISPAYNGWIDLFGWGTGNNPTNSSTNDEDFDTFNDWGYNAISNGGSVQNKWYTLSIDEWYYVFNNRNTSSGIRFARAQVNGINGVVLLPDDWDDSYYSLNSTNINDANFTSNIISSLTWISDLESKGAVFLPLAGCRYINTVSDVGSSGRYWSSTRYSWYGNDINTAHLVLIYDNGLQVGHVMDRHMGHSVRLVCDAE